MAAILRGEDMFAGPENKHVTAPDKRFIVRFHLHPSVKATLAPKVVMGRADAPAQRPLLAPAARAAPASVCRKHLSRRGRSPAPHRADRARGQVPAEGIAIKWALTRMEG